ncbi:putative multiheme cytochrome c [Thermincola ferriacetica]|uniref:Putative multiheme cytochrome c n=1 Tax=Thermincola ferriacetica TaxID=281456 RepID=A0A0L6W1S5_9FIRM|nr:Ig-like domain-containing protein [Thermincola ferriacetica]KNZ69353.1 putative multiheme cytochrome c [Thermincola ferriacetica]
MRITVTTTGKKLNYRKFGKRIGLLALVIVTAVAAFFYFNSSTVAVTSKPTVYIVDVDYAANSSGDRMRSYLTSQGYTVNWVNATTTLPSHAEANGYDVIIFSTGDLGTTSLNDTDLQWVYDQLNDPANNHRVIVEGDALPSEINGSANSATFRAGILHATAIGSLQTNSTYTFNRLNSTHYVVSGGGAGGTGINISGTNPTYSNFTTNDFRPITEDANSTPLYKYSTTTTQPYTVLSAWEGTNRASRSVVMSFLWYNGTQGITTQSWREGLLKNSVDWVGEFMEASFTSMAPANVNPGTTGVQMGRLFLQNNISGENTTLTGFSVQQTGTATKDSNVTTVKIYADANNDGTIDTPSTPLATANFSGGTATFSGLNFTVDSTGKSIIITYDVAAGAEQTKSLRLKVLTNTFTNQEGSLIKTIGTFESNATLINDITPPSVPQGVYTTNLGTGTGLKISWSPNTEPDLSGYKIYRDTSPTGSFNTLVGSVPAGTTNITDSGLTEFTRYYYKVTAYDTSSNESDKASSTAVVGIPNRPPATPAGLNVTDPAVGRTLIVSWSAVTDEPLDPFNGNTPDLAGYNLYVAGDPAGPYGKVNATPITDTTYTHIGLKDGNTYYYKVAAVDRYGAESVLSAAVSGTPSDSTPPQITSVYPAEGQDLVPRNIIVKVTFDDPLDPASVNSAVLRIVDQNNLPVPGTVSYDAINGQIRFTFDSVLPAAGSFKAILDGTAPDGVKNAAGLYLGFDKEWTFGTLINPHANFTTNTTLCGYCHSAHSATGVNIIRAPKIIDLCLLCHDGTGSSYDVKAGIYFNGDVPTPLLSGGYDLAMGSTSTHFTDLANSVFGGSADPMTVDCNNCHEPHGTSNYRNLRTTVNGRQVTVTGVVYGPAYAVKTTSGREVATYVYGFNDFCGACHFDYLVYNSENTADKVINWRHRVGVGMTGGSPGGDFVVSYPAPGLYTTLPTEGAPTGANLTNYEILDGGSLGPATYNYIVTARNAVGESVYGSILQVTNGAAGQKIKIFWEPITNAYKYRIYRYVGPLDVKKADVSKFSFLAEVGDAPTSFVDDGSYTPDVAVHPPTTSNAKINCLTCHYSHGTTAVADGPTRLRRLDYNGVCEDCHKK